MAEAVPTYTMGIFKLSNALCDQITSLVRNFWWGKANEKNKMAWLSCDKMCKPKEEGGFYRKAQLHWFIGCLKLTSSLTETFCRLS